MRLNTNDTRMVGGINDKKSVIDATLPLSLTKLKQEKNWDLIEL